MPLTAQQVKSSPRPTPDSEWLTVVQVAREYNIPRQTIYKLAIAGKLPYYVIPSGRRRFRRSEVEPLLAMHRVPAKENDPLDGLEGPVRVTTEDAAG